MAVQNALNIYTYMFRQFHSYDSIYDGITDRYTVNSRYNVVPYNTLYHKAIRRLNQNINQSIKSRITPISEP